MPSTPRPFNGLRPAYRLPRPRPRRKIPLDPVARSILLERELATYATSMRATLRLLTAVTRMERHRPGGAPPAAFHLLLAQVRQIKLRRMVLQWRWQHPSSAAREKMRGGTKTSAARPAEKTSEK